MPKDVDVVRKVADLRQNAAELQERARELNARAVSLIEQAKELEMNFAPAKKKSLRKREASR